MAAAIGICFAREDSPPPRNPFSKAIDREPKKTAEQIDRDSRIGWNAAFKAMGVKRKQSKG
jgi:hypothetical protein